VRLPPTRLVATAALVVTVVTACNGAVAAGPQIPPASVSRPVIQRTLTAHGIELKPADLTAPAGSDILIAFDNADPGVPHGLVLYGDAAHTITLGAAPVVVGPDHQVFRVAGLALGRYQFSCVVHPMMVANLVVGS